jgi:hypothetical protein
MIVARTSLLMLRQGWREPAVGSSLRAAITHCPVIPLALTQTAIQTSYLAIAASQTPHSLPLRELFHRSTIGVAIQSP